VSISGRGVGRDVCCEGHDALLLPAPTTHQPSLRSLVLSRLSLYLSELQSLLLSLCLSRLRSLSLPLSWRLSLSESLSLSLSLSRLLHHLRVKSPRNIHVRQHRLIYMYAMEEVTHMCVVIHNSETLRCVRADRMNVASFHIMYETWDKEWNPKLKERNSSSIESIQVACVSGRHACIMARPIVHMCKALVQVDFGTKSSSFPYMRMCICACIYIYIYTYIYIYIYTHTHTATHTHTHTQTYIYIN
jgi:hypothetical protein